MHFVCSFALLISKRATLIKSSEIVIFHVSIKFKGFGFSFNWVLTQVFGDCFSNYQNAEHGCGAPKNILNA